MLKENVDIFLTSQGRNYKSFDTLLLRRNLEIKLGSPQDQLKGSRGHENSDHGVVGPRERFSRLHNERALD